MADAPTGKLVLVTAINPTPAGEGKTTTSIGLPKVPAAEFIDVDEAGHTVGLF